MAAFRHRLLLAGSLVVFVVGAAQPLAAAPRSSMCEAISVGTDRVDVNGADVSFVWTADGFTWSARGAQDDTFRVHVEARGGEEVIWGATGSWSGERFRSVTACHCPKEPPTTTTTTEPPTTAATTTTAPAGVVPAVTTTAATTTTLVAAVAPPSTQAAVAVLGTQVQASSAQVQAVAAQEMLPVTGLTTTAFALIGSALLGLGALIVWLTRKPRHE